MALLLLAIVLPVNSAEVIVSPRISSMSYERLLEPESLSEQLGLDQESLITSTSIDDVNGQLVLDRLIALSDPDYMLVPGDTISVSYIERAAIDPVTLLLTVPYGGRLNISNIATIETDGKTFQNVRSEIEAAPFGSLVLATVKPGTLPCSNWAGEVTTPTFRFSAFTVVMELVTSFRCILP